MKKTSGVTGKVSRRVFLGAGAAGLGLTGFPARATQTSPSPNRSQASEAVMVGKHPPVFLVRNGRPTATIVVPAEPSVLNRMAEETITDSIQRRVNLTLTSLKGSTDFPELADRNLVVLGTPRSNPLVAKWEGEQRVSLKAAGKEGYAIHTRQNPEGSCCVLLAANSDKGIYQGATRLTDFLLTTDAHSVAVPAVSAVDKPAIELRGTYNLACWGLAPRYTRADWERVISAMAEDHMNFVYFWLGGLFRSKKFPEAFIYPETPLTNDDIHALIKYAQDRDIRFYLGAGAFAWYGEDTIGLYHPEARETGQPYLCRTLPTSRRLVDEYLSEMYDSFPEADGMYLEIGCEGDYHCTGPLCQKPLDEFGSKQIGESELSFLREFSEKLWKKNPKLKFVWPVGYPESHKWDVRYYEQIRVRMTDPRYFWMEARQNWQLPDAAGSLRPLEHLSKNILHWDQHYAMPLLDMRDRARRVLEAGISGYVVAYEPGFATASIYGTRIPFPVDLIPYRLTRFAFREFTWNPNLSWDEFRARVHKKFFSPQMSQGFVDILATLREFMREGPLAQSPMVGSLARYGTQPSQEQIASFAETLRPRLVAMEAEVNAQSSKAQGIPPEGITLIQTCIRDLRAAYHLS